jgi:octaprenyl-diphosphate synthase
MTQPPAVIHPFIGAVHRISPSLDLVERAMREQLDSRCDLLPELGEHVLGSGGKRLRPALLLLAAELCGYSGPRRIQVAAAVELLHTATLLHDDVVDISSLRRGRPSANAIWGNRRAVLAGDFLYARASSMIVEDGDLDILWIFSNTIRCMAEGELLQLGRSFDATVTEAHYFSVIEHKSAVLLSAACEAGAILGGVTRAERRKMAQFGRELGLAFQLRDDALDYEAGEAELGKRPLTDIREGRPPSSWWSDTTASRIRSAAPRITWRGPRPRSPPSPKAAPGATSWRLPALPWRGIASPAALHFSPPMVPGEPLHVRWNANRASVDARTTGGPRRRARRVARPGRRRDAGAHRRRQREHGHVR